MNLNDQLKLLMKKIRENSRIVLSSLILIIVILFFSSYLKQLIIGIIFIVLAGISKIYHRFVKNSLGVDLVLFLTLMIALIYRNTLLSFLVGFIGLIAADILGQRFSHTSLISLVGMTVVILLANITVFPLHISLVLLTIIFEVIAGFLYNIMGSSVQRMLVFLFSHFVFNMILIFSLADWLAMLM